MKKDRSLGALLLLSLAFLLPLGCGGGGQEQSAKGTEKSQQAAETQAAPAQTQPREATTAYTPNPEHGKQLFLQVCAACHGPDAKGLPNLGKDLTTSKFIQEKTDQELLAFVKVGRSPTDPLNTTGIAMPPKGGNPALTDQDILDIIAYLRTLQQKPIP